MLPGSPPSSRPLRLLLHPLLALCLVLIVLAAPVALASRAAEAYDWRSVPIGGGGSIPTITFHPKVKDLAYITTDVGGVYRWDTASNTWIQLLDWLSLADQDLNSAQSLAIDPNDETGNIVYLAAGTDSWNTRGEMWKSTDRGDTWTRTGHRVWIASNWQQTHSNTMQVDPHNSSIVYYASREGLIASTDAGLTWAPMPSAPTGDVQPQRKEPSGTFLFVADTSSGVIENPRRTRVLYLGAFDKERRTRLHRSTDGGLTWHELEDAPVRFNRARVNRHGELWITHRRGLSRFDGRAWTHVDSLPQETFVQIGIDPNNHDRMLASRHFWGFRCPMFFSEDRGRTWRQIEDEHDHSTIPWYPKEKARASTFAAEFNPFAPGEVWYSDWYMVWRTRDIAAPTVAWSMMPWNIEETVGIGDGLISPPVGPPLLSGLADVTGFVHEQFESYPEKTLRHLAFDFNAAVTGADFAEHKPSTLVVVAVRDWTKAGDGAISDDSGRTWTRFGSRPHPEAGGGRVAISADGRHIVWDTAGNGIYATADRGATWQTVRGLRNARGEEAGSMVDRFIFNYQSPLAADRVNGHFYAHDGAGNFYRSEDGGVNWKIVNTELPKAVDRKIKTVPGRAGEVWVAFERNGLFRSTDGGATFERRPDVRHAHYFSFGKGPTDDTPSAYLYGRLEGEEREGIYRSDDMGRTWIAIHDYRRFPNKPQGMAGCRQVHGRVFIATGGRGIFMATPAARD